MPYINEQIHEFNGLKVHLIPTDKFKTVTMFLQFCSPLNEKDVTKRALLSYVLKSSTKHSPSAQDLQKRLDDLYGASFASMLSKKGDYHILTLYMTAANERFISGASAKLFDESVKLLSEAVFEPAASDRQFDEKIVEREKRSLRARLESIYDDKMRYASQRLIDEMCQHELYRLHTYGYSEELDQVTADGLFEYYKKMMAEDQVDLYIIGDIQEKQSHILNTIQSALPFDKRQNKTRDIRINFNPVIPNEIKVVKENQDVEQGKLNLGYRTNIIYGDPLYYASQVFNGLFGGFPHSKLFMNVREKESLAYYASSSYESYKGLMIVMSGIEFSNYDKAVDIIKEQLEAVKNGDFTEHDIDQTKALLRNAVLEALDNPASLTDFLYRQVLTGQPVTAENWLHAIDQVRKEDIIKVAEKTTLDTIYFLQGEEAE
ncbi:putative Zn-dependent peptidase [Scopulibacillus daqui]|uniref:Zn-dependent peptidase n=1 Tax=Scopulibacillus daqui TaxID=1469162 RepID=A0ABS2PX18_9BACL|nr:pitrilysin family protein [Scopulibacillus daqui]MBM7644406.1 putative Zn-dependent peptidase [Scopulibacillus daqui]